MSLNNAINAPIPIAASKGGSGLVSPTANGILTANGASPFTSNVLTDGQLLIGDTGSAPVIGSLTPGSNIAITPGAGSITISASGSAGFAWNDVTTSTQALAVHNGYVTNNGATLVTFTLPVTAAFGTEIAICGFSTGGWKIAQNAGQLIHLGDDETVAGVTGSLNSTDTFDQVRLVCVVADTRWIALYAVGNLSLL